jgi:hypothetical protein
MAFLIQTKKFQMRKRFHLNLFQYIGWRHLSLRPGRTALTTLGVALGIALYVAIAIINESPMFGLGISYGFFAISILLIICILPELFRFNGIRQTSALN